MSIQQQYFQKLFKETEILRQQKKEKLNKTQKKQSSSENLLSSINTINEVYVLEDYLSNNNFLKCFNKSGQNFMQIQLIQNQDVQNNTQEQFQIQIQNLSKEQGCYQNTDILKIQLIDIEDDIEFIKQNFVQYFENFQQIQQQFKEWKQSKNVLNLDFNDKEELNKNVNDNIQEDFLQNVMDQLDQQYEQKDDKEISPLQEDTQIVKQRRNIKKKQQLCKILSYIDINPEQLIEMLMKLDLCESIQKDYLNDKIFQHNIHSEITKKQFNKKYFDLINLSQSILQQDSQYNDSQIFLFLKEFDCYNNAYAKWENQLHTLPTLMEWKDKDNREKLDKIDQFIQGDLSKIKENKIEKFYKKIADFIILKTVKNENQKIDKNLKLLHNNKIKIEISKNNLLQKFDLYKENLIPIEQEIKQQMIDVQLELEKFNQKLKKNQEPRYQHIVEYFEDYDCFNKKHSYSEMNLNINNQQIYLNFIPYFNKDLIKENLNDFYDNYSNVQNQREFGLGLYFKVSEELVFQVLPSGEFYFQNINLQDESLKVNFKGDVVIQKNEILQVQAEQSLMIPQEDLLEEELDYEEFVKKSKEKAQKKQANKQEEIQEKQITDSDNEIPQIQKQSKIEIFRKDGQRYTFSNKQWITINNEGKVFKNEEEINQLKSMQRSQYFQQDFPFCEIREDGLKKIHVKENQTYTIFDNNLQYLQFEDYTQIQKSMYPVVHIKNKKQFEQQFSQQFLEQFEDNFIEVNIGNNIQFQLLKKQEGHLIIIQTQKEIYLVTDQGEVYYTKKQLIENFDSVVNQQIKFKQSLDIYLTELQKTVYMLKTAESKFQKQKKKKKKDIQKYENLKQEIIQNFIKEVQTQLISGKKQVKKVENEVEQNTPQQINEEIQSQQDNESMAYTLENLKGNNQLLENLILEYELEMQQIHEEKRKTLKEKIDIYQKEKRILEEIKSLGKSQAFFNIFLQQNQCLEGNFIFNLKQSKVVTTNYDTKEIQVNITDDNSFNKINYFEALDMTNIDNNIEDCVSYKTTGIDITDEDLQQFFDQYFYTINQPTQDMLLFLKQNNKFYKLERDLNLQDYNMMEDQQIKYYGKQKQIKNNNKKYEKLNFQNKIDLLMYDEIQQANDLVKEQKNMKVYYQYSDNMSKEQLEQKLNKYKKWQQWDQFQGQHFGFKLESLDKKKQQIYQGFEAPCINNLIQKQKYLNDLQQNINLDYYQEKLQDQIQQDQSNIQTKEKSIEENQNQIQIVKKQFPALKVKKKQIEEIQQKEMQEQCSQYFDNYFDTYEGQLYVKNNLKKDQKEYVSLQDQQIINSLIQKSKVEQIDTQNIQEKTESDFSNKTKTQKEQSTKNNTQKNFKIKTLSYTKKVELETLKYEKEEQEKLKQERQKRTHKYDVTGNIRKEQPFVKSLYKNDKIKKKKNIKYIEVESQVDNRIKTSSMANKLYIQAASTYQVRNYAPHQTLLQSLDKNKPKDFQILRKNLMPIYEYNQSDLKDLAFFPTILDFKNLKQGTYYKTKLKILNENALSQRIIVRTPIQYPNIYVVIDQGPIAPGMKKTIQVEIDTKESLTGFFETELTIISKHYEYNIPIKGYIMNLNESQKVNFQPNIKKNMFDVKEEIKKTKTFKIKELKESMQNTENFNMSNLQTSQNIPKMHYDTNMKLTLTRQTHEEN